MKNALNSLFTRPQSPPAKPSIPKTLVISGKPRPVLSLQTHLDAKSSLNLGVLTPLNLPISPPSLLIQVLCLDCEFGGRSFLSSEIGSRRIEMVERNFRKRKKLTRRKGRKGGWCAVKQAWEMWGRVGGGAPFCDGWGIRKLKFYGAVVRVVLVFSSVGAELDTVVVLPMSGGCGWVAGPITDSSCVALGEIFSPYSTLVELLLKSMSIYIIFIPISFICFRIFMKCTTHGWLKNLVLEAYASTLPTPRFSGLEKTLVFGAVMVPLPRLNEDMVLLKFGYKCLFLACCADMWLICYALCSSFPIRIHPVWVYIPDDVYQGPMSFHVLMDGKWGELDGEQMTLGSVKLLKENSYGVLLKYVKICLTDSLATPIVAPLGSYDWILGLEQLGSQAICLSTLGHWITSRCEWLTYSLLKGSCIILYHFDRMLYHFLAGRLPLIAFPHQCNTCYLRGVSIAGSGGFGVQACLLALGVCGTDVSVAPSVGLWPW